MTLAWAAAAVVIAAASFVMGLAGFGIALVALAFLPYLMAASDAIVLLTIYAAVMSLAMLVQLRESVEPRAMLDLVVGTIAGTPLGVWGLSALPPSVLNRLIGLMLVVDHRVQAHGDGGVGPGGGGIVQEDRQHVSVDRDWERGEIRKLSVRIAGSIKENPVHF